MKPTIKYEVGQRFTTTDSPDIHKGVEFIILEIHPQDFIEHEELTVDKLFSKTKAKGAYYLRNIKLNANYLVNSIKGFNAEKSIKVDREVVTAVKTAMRAADAFVKEFEE